MMYERLNYSELQDALLILQFGPFARLEINGSELLNFDSHRAVGEDFPTKLALDAVL